MLPIVAISPMHRSTSRFSGSRRGLMGWAPPSRFYVVTSTWCPSAPSTSTWRRGASTFKSTASVRSRVTNFVPCFDPHLCSISCRHCWHSPANDF